MNPRARILVIDDDRDVRELLAQHLHERFDVAFAADSRSAIEMAQRHDPDLILLDLGLPTANGDVVLARLRRLSRFADTPVIVVTARDPRAARETLRASLIAACITKPFTRRGLIGAIERALGLPAARVAV